MLKYYNLEPNDLANIESRIHIAINTQNVLNLQLNKVKTNEETQNVNNYIIFDGGEIVSDPSSFANYDGVGKERIII